MILAGGRGSRLRPVSTTIPKELLPVGTRPLFQWCLTEVLEGGFDDVGVVLSDEKPLLETYLREGRWREGILPAIRAAADELEITVFRQSHPHGVVDAILSADAWLDEDNVFAVFLPDNVRIGGGPTLTAGHMQRAAEDGRPVVVCHRVGSEAGHFFGNVGRTELDELVPAGVQPRVAALQERGAGFFRAPAEGAWRLAPRYVVTAAWLSIARSVVEDSAAAGIEADDVEVHRRLAAMRMLDAAPWTGTLVDAGHPGGYLYAQHLLHEAGEREREAPEADDLPGSVVHIQI